MRETLNRIKLTLWEFRAEGKITTEREDAKAIIDELAMCIYKQVKVIEGETTKEGRA